MLKKFVEVNADASPSENPYAVRTFMGDNVITEWKVENCPPRERVCQKKPPANCCISQVLTIEDELRRLHFKAAESRFVRPYKKKCAVYDEHTMCIIPQRLQGEIHLHDEMRELYLKDKGTPGLVTHDARIRKVCPKELVCLNSPINMDEGVEEDDDEVRPEIATPECSSDMIIIPDPRIVSSDLGLYCTA